MKTSLLGYLLCPLCRSRLELTVAEQVQGVVETGSLLCSRCSHSFPIRNGIPNMLSSQLPHIEDKLREAHGWVQLSQQEKWYQPEERIDLALPYVVEKLGWDLATASSWAATTVSFEQLLAKYVRSGMRVLEVGAAKSWAGRYFNERGCEYTACDIMDDHNIGLGRSRFFIERFGHYEVVVADAESLPFADGYFDVVFAIATLHHALNLRQMIREMARVVRRGGIVAALNEGVRSFRASPEAETQSKEKLFGINEHVHTLWDYYKPFRLSGLRVTEITRSIGYDQLIATDLKARVDRLLRFPVIGKWAAVLLALGFTLPHDGVTLYARKH